MATSGWIVLLVLVALPLARSELPPPATRGSLNSGVQLPASATERPIDARIDDSGELPAGTENAIERLREEPTKLHLSRPPWNITTLTTKLKRIQRPIQSGVSPELSFVLGLRSSVARTSRLQSPNKGIHASLDATSGIFTEAYGHAMEVQFGTPPQASLLLLVDTASSLTWTQCVPCWNCVYQHENMFNPATSKTYWLVSCADSMCNYLENVDPATSGSCNQFCQFKVSYGDGTFCTGSFVKETLTLAGAGSSVPNVYVGCGYHDNGYDGYDGVAGLDASSLSLAQQLGAFSFCFLPSGDTRSSPIVFGNPAFPADSPAPGFANTFVNPITHAQYYYVNMVSISVNGVAINVPSSAFTINVSDGSGGVFVDSGTSFTVLHDVVYDALVAQLVVALPTTVSPGQPPCWPTPAAGSPPLALPTVALHMLEGSMVIALEGTYQVLGASTCLAMARSTDLNAPQVIGNYQMINQFLVFEPSAGRMQFSMYDCTKLAS